MDWKCTHFIANTLVTSNKYVQCKWRKEFEWHLQRPKSFLGRRRKKTLRRWVFPDALIKKTYTAGGVESVQFRKCDHYAAARCVWHSCPQRRPKYRAHPCVSLSFKFSLFYELKCTSLICKKKVTHLGFLEFLFRCIIHFSSSEFTFRFIWKFVWYIP